MATDGESEWEIITTLIIILNKGSWAVGCSLGEVLVHNLEDRVFFLEAM